LTPNIPIYANNANRQATRKFHPIAFRWLGYLIQKVGLSPTDRFLEVGCGAAQIAYSLAYYLEPTGSYQGFDIADRGIYWARQEIAPRKPNFNFDRYDIYHPIYNPTGTLAAKDFIFPYPDASFDCVCIRDLFTHLQAKEVWHYLMEISRVLKLGGRCLFACFLLNLESEEAIALGNSSQNLVCEWDNCFATDANISDWCVGLKESLLLNWIDSLGFRVLYSSYGSWCGRLSCNYEDLLVLEKKA
jgi:SAM-dependent methyltransferase